MRFTIILLLLFLFDFYFYKSTSISKMYANSNIISIIYWSICLLIYFFIFYVFFNSNNILDKDQINFTVINSLIMIWIISRFFGSLLLFTDDIFRLFKYIINLFLFNTEYSTSRLEFLKKSALAVSGILAGSLLLGMKFGRYNFKKHYLNIKISRWNSELNNYKIIHISDLHLGSFQSTDKLEEVVELINIENADLIVFTGDLVNNYFYEALPYVKILKKLKAKDGKFSILGNHDYGDYTAHRRSSQEWKDNFKNMINTHKNIGFNLLLNESTIISSVRGSFNLIGVENWGKGEFNKDGDLLKATSKISKDLPNILLSHDPSHWSEQVTDHSDFIDLQLSGHTHGMQFGVEIADIKWSPIKFRYKEWAGLYKKNNHQIYVNRGLGHLGYAGRVGIMPDISVLNIKSI